jgi:hypothetical protein
MDYTNFNIIKIIPGIYIGDANTKYYENKLTGLNIHYLININKTLSGTSFTTYNISIDANTEYIDSSLPVNIDLNTTNEFIVSALQNNLNILICDINYLIPVLITGAFLIKYINVGYTECIYWLSQKTNINTISKNICYQLFLYYKENN